LLYIASELAPNNLRRARIQGSYTFVSPNYRLKGLLGPVSRVIKKLASHPRRTAMMAFRTLSAEGTHPNTHTHRVYTHRVICVCLSLRESDRRRQRKDQLRLSFSRRESLRSTPKAFLVAGPEPFLVRTEQILCKNGKRFQGGLVFEAHRLLYHSTLGWRVIKKKKNRATRRATKNFSARNGPTVRYLIRTNPPMSLRNRLP